MTTSFRLAIALPACLLSALLLWASPGNAQVEPVANENESESADEAEAPAGGEEQKSLDLTDVKVSFPGQYRINAYSVDDDGKDGQQTAARLRIRQGLDIDFGAGFRTHLELQLNHTSSNRGVSEDSVRVRHAVMELDRDRVGRFAAGIVPLSDRFGDALFSGDWDYNLLAIVAEPRLGEGSAIRLFAGNLDEGVEDLSGDDVVHYQAELELPMDRLDLVLAGTLIQAPDATGTSRDYWSLGASSAHEGEKTQIRGFVVYSETEAELADLEKDARGVAVLASIERRSDRLRWGGLASWAEGGADGSGFAPPMSLVGFNGYWGYTGILTVQGPTDTGFDGDAVNVSNNGYGLRSLQVRAIVAASERLDVTAAAGWFGGSRAQGRSGRVGVDLLLMGSYQLHRVLTIDFGVAAAELEDSVSGYFQGVAGEFNQPVGIERRKVALFTRLQAAF